MGHGVAIVHDPALEAEADRMGKKVAILGQMPSGIQRSRANPYCQSAQQRIMRPVVQRWLVDSALPSRIVGMGSMPIADDRPISITDHKSLEIVSDSRGTDSSTQLFTAGAGGWAGAEYLSSDAFDIYFKGVKLGTIFTGTRSISGSNLVSIVKMHIVNSFLHKNANNWTGNWAWGSFYLNKKHSQIEERAKDYHPCYEVGKSKGSKLLHYEAEFTNSRPECISETDFKSSMENDIRNYLVQSVKTNNIDAAIVNSDLMKVKEDQVEIRERNQTTGPVMTMSKFYEKWHRAVKNNAYDEIYVISRYHNGIIWQDAVEDTAKVLKNDSEKYRVSFNPDKDPMGVGQKLTRVFFDNGGITSKTKRNIPASDLSEKLTKKLEDKNPKRIKPS